MPAASAMADPDMPEKIRLATTLTWARPPRKRPTIARQKASSRSLTVPAFMKLAATMNSGTASSTKELNRPFSACSATSPTSWPLMNR